MKLFTPDFVLGFFAGFGSAKSLLTLLGGAALAFILKLSVSIFYSLSSSEIRDYIEEHFPHFKIPKWLGATLALLAILITGTLLTWLLKP